jgi:dTDP-4-dehydrorhamnose reductase
LRFLGDKGSYSEESIKDARDLYGVSKGLGEVSGGNNMTVLALLDLS